MTRLTELTKGPLINSQSWTVGTGGDYANFPDAINAYLAQPTLRSVQVTITALTGYVITNADQYSFLFIDAPNLYLDTQSLTSVNGTGFVGPFGTYPIFTVLGSRVGGINGQYQLTTPMPSAQSAVVLNYAGSVLQSEQPVSSIVAQGFKYATVSASAKSYSISLDTNGGVRVSGDQSTILQSCNFTGYSSALGTRIIEAADSSEVFLDGTDISTTDVSVDAIYAAEASEVNVKSGAMSVAGRFGNLFSGSCLKLNGTSIAVDQTVTNTLFSLVSGSSLFLDSLSLSITGNTPGWYLFDITPSCTVQANGLAVSALDWTNISPYPIGQRFAAGGGVFGLSVDGSMTGKVSLAGTEGGTIARPLYSSEVEITGGPFNALSFSDDLFALPVGATVRISSTAPIGALTLQFNAAPYNVPALMGYEVLTIVRTNDSIVVTSVDETAPNRAGRPLFLPVILPNGTASYNVTLNDLDRTIVFDHNGSCSLNLPSAASVALPAGFQLNCRNLDPGGAITVVPAGGDTVTGAGTVTNIHIKVFSVYLEYENAGVRRWVTAGDLV